METQQSFTFKKCKDQDQICLLQNGKLLVKFCFNRCRTFHQVLHIVYKK